MHNPKLGVTMLAMEGGCGLIAWWTSHTAPTSPSNSERSLRRSSFKGKPYELFQRTDEFS